jgi:hypothetical protein
VEVEVNGVKQRTGVKIKKCRCVLYRSLLEFIHILICFLLQDDPRRKGLWSSLKLVDISHYSLQHSNLKIPNGISGCNDGLSDFESFHLSPVLERLSEPFVSASEHATRYGAFSGVQK